MGCDIAPRRATEQIDAGSQPPVRVRRWVSRWLSETVPSLRAPIFRRFCAGRRRATRRSRPCARSVVRWKTYRALAANRGKLCVWGPELVSDQAHTRQPTAGFTPSHTYHTFHTNIVVWNVWYVCTKSPSFKVKKNDNLCKWVVYCDVMTNV